MTAIYATILKRRKVILHPNGRILSDHCDNDGRRVWRCSACGRQGLWTASWSAFGTAETTEAVYCSDGCRP